MKFSAVTFFAVAASVGTAAASKRAKTSKIDTSNFAADSEAARKLISKSHRRDEDMYFNANYISRHSVVYKGCQNLTSWGDEGMYSQIVVTFDLCPTKYCSEGSCGVSVTGSYAVDLDTFLESYLESKMEEREYRCEVMKDECGCDGDADDCMYYCWKNYDDGITWSDCYEEENEEERYGVCDRLEIRDDEEEGRRLENNNGEYEYYMGPVCSSDGEIHLSLYWDEYCTNEVSNAANVYYKLAGASMPYTDESLITSAECTSCKEPGDADEQMDDDRADADDVTRMCEEVYTRAIKCEDYGKYPNRDGCSYLSNLNRNLMVSSTVEKISHKTSFFLGGLVVAAIGAVAFFMKRK